MLQHVAEALVTGLKEGGLFEGLDGSLAVSQGLAGNTEIGPGLEVPRIDPGRA